MKVSVLAVGTRGDLQPAIALGKALKCKGHAVSVVASSNYRDWIEAHGLHAARIGVDMEALLRSDLGRDWAGKSNNPIAEALAGRRLFNAHAMTTMADAWEACRDAEALVSNALSDAFALAVAEKTGARHVSCWPVPSLRPTRSGAALVGAPFPRRRSVLNLLFGKLFLEPYPWLLCSSATNRFRTEVLGLPARGVRDYVAAMRHLPVLHGYSRHVVPHPPDWPAHVHTTGYWVLEESDGWEPPAGLRAFIEEGEPPVYIGFGSMTQKDAEATTRLILEAIRLSGRRAVLLAGWAGIGQADLPSNVFGLQYAPFSWLFPRVAAVVHHGGAGTTAAGWRAGVPMMVVPHIGDQYFWGERVRALGTGPRPIPRHKLTALALAGAIRRASTDPRMKRRAEELGARIRAEDGTSKSAELIDHYMNGGSAAGAPIPHVGRSAEVQATLYRDRR